jgi:acetyl-CoA carboxylase biotin carboxyl carrier protein
MKLNEIQDLIKFVAKSGVSEVNLETKEIKIVIKTGLGGKAKADGPVVIQATAAPSVIPAPQVVQAAAPAVAVESKANTPPATNKSSEESRYVTIKSPMIGTFYRSPGPDKSAFANVGDEVAPGKTVCIIEAMKLFNEIESDVKGRIVKVLVDDASPVEYEQPLFLVDPA